MVKRVCILFLALSLLLCSCAGKESKRRNRIPEWPFRMTATVEMQTEQTTFTADWEYRDGQSAFTLRAPQELHGMTITCSTIECRVECGGVQAELPQQSAFVLLDRAYRALSDGLVEPQNTSEGWLYDGMDRYGFEALGVGDGSLQIRFPKAKAQAAFTVVPTEPA